MLAHCSVCDQLESEGVDDSCVLGVLPYDHRLFQFLGKTSVLVCCMFHQGMGDEEDDQDAHNRNLPLQIV